MQGTCAELCFSRAAAGMSFRRACRSNLAPGDVQLGTLTKMAGSTQLRFSVVRHSRGLGVCYHSAAKYLVTVTCQ